MPLDPPPAPFVALDVGGTADAIGAGIRGRVEPGGSRVLACPNLPQLNGLALRVMGAARVAMVGLAG
jgi:hypothetical protein